MILINACTGASTYKLVALGLRCECCKIYSSIKATANCVRVKVSVPDAAFGRDVRWARAARRAGFRISASSVAILEFNL